MRALRLEAFAPEDEETAKARRAAEDASKSAYEAGYRKGFADGAAASAEEQMRSQEQLRAQFVEALRDSELSHSAACTEVSKAMYSVLRTLLARLAPCLAATSAPVEILNRVEAAFDQVPQAQMTIHCAPELVETLREAVGGKSLPVLISPDPRFTPLEARIDWAEGFDRIDFDAALADIEVILSQFQDVQLQPQSAELADAG